VAPVPHERLHRRQLHALRSIFDGLLLGQTRRHDARTQILDFRLRDLDRERPDRRRAGDLSVVAMWVLLSEVMDDCKRERRARNSPPSRPWDWSPGLHPWVLPGLHPWVLRGISDH
jgi:hypothetical protein